MSDNSNTTYVVTITRIEKIEVTKNGEHKTIEQRPWTEEELSKEMMSSHYGDRKEFLEKSPLKNIYGYAPSQKVIETVEREIYKQRVNSLDLPKVITAVNDL